MSDNRVSKQVKVKDKVKRDRYIIAINYKLSWGKIKQKILLQATS